MTTPPLTHGRGGGWHDEWHVWGDPSVEIGGVMCLAEPYDHVFDSRDPRHRGLLAQAAAYGFVRAAHVLGRTPWLDGPHLRRRRVFEGSWEDVDVRPPHRRAARDVAALPMLLPHNEGGVVQ